MPNKAPIAARPSKAIFDPFNSSATGHQRAENKLSGSTSWRDSRHRKLHQQFSSGAGGGKRVSDSVGAGSLDFGRDGRTENGGFEKGAKGLRKSTQKSLWESVTVSKADDVSSERPSKRIKTEETSAKPCSTKFVNPYTPFRKEDGNIRETSWTSLSDLLEPINPLPSTDESCTSNLKQEEETKDVDPQAPPQIFSSLNFYINGSTYPLSDHALKHLISSHGGNMSIALGRKTVTHVIIGKTNSRGGGGSGGGLSGSKIQKEITSMRGKGIKFISAEWISESVKAGKRLPESRFVGMNLAPKGVSGIQSMFGAVANE